MADERGNPKLYAGPPVGCCWCSYGTHGEGHIKLAPPATHVIGEGRDAREVCLTHALRGRWDARARRVGAVA